MKGGPEQHALGAFDGSFNLWAAEGRARGAACCAHVCNPHSEGSRETPPSASLVRTLFLFPKPRRRDRVGSVETTEGRCFFFFWGGVSFPGASCTSHLFFFSCQRDRTTLPFEVPGAQGEVRRGARVSEERAGRRRGLSLVAVVAVATAAGFAGSSVVASRSLLLLLLLLLCSPLPAPDQHSPGNALGGVVAMVDERIAEAGIVSKVVGSGRRGSSRIRRADDFDASGSNGA